jgi:hypothetical protein
MTAQPIDASEFKPPPATTMALEQGVLRTEIDQQANIIRVLGRGLWSERYARAHFEELEWTLQRTRATRAPVRVLVDIREAAVQTPETTQCLADATDRLYKPGDRIAIVVASSLLKLQMRRATNASIHEIFISLNAAETWLSAWS